MKDRYLKRMYLVAENGKDEIREQVKRLAGKLMRQGLEVQLTTPEEKQTDIPAAEGSLCLTDSSELVKELMRQHKPVIAWLHEGNRGKDFGEVLYAVEEPEELEVSFFEQIYRRYRGIPWLIAETGRCLIRETIPEDATAFSEIYRDPEITRYTEGFSAEADTERETIREYIQKFYEFYGFGVWTVLWKETGEVIGRVGFERPEAPELGYMIATPWQGKGIATEVCSAVLRVAKEELGFTQVRARIHCDHAASLRVISRLGFHEIGRNATETVWLKDL